MDCKAFHRTLEDYLEGGLDFPGRFEMERHARQCLSCGSEVSDAQRLHQMVSELQRVKAPSDFEASVLREIGVRKTHRRFSGFRSLWIYGFEWPSFQKLALAFSCLALLCFGFFYVSYRTVFDRASTIPQITSAPAAMAVETKDAGNSPRTNLETLVQKKQAAAEPLKLAKRVRPPALLKHDPVIEEAIQGMQEVQDTDYMEYSMPGPDNRPVPVRLPLPKIIPMRYSQMSEEYFIQNVSH